MNPEIVNILYNFLPELTLSLTIVIINILHSLRKTSDTGVYIASVTGLAAALVFSLLQAYTPMQSAFGGLLVLDHLSYFGKSVSLSAILLIALFFFRKEHSSNEFLLIPAIALSSAIAVSSSNLVLTFISLELISISIYLLISGCGKLSFRYFVYGSVLSGMMLFGMTILYGVCGSFDYYAIGSFLSQNPFNTLTLSISVILITAGIAFKMYLFPFNFYYPALTEKIPLRTFGLISIPLITVLSIMALRFYTIAFHDSGDFASESTAYSFVAGVKWDLMYAIIGTISVLAGNLVILRQYSLRKIFSFLLIAQSGFIILGMASPTISGTEAMLFNVLVFTAAGGGLFYCLRILEEEYQITELASVKGLGKSNPLLIIALVIFLASFAGFPLTAGFPGRLLLTPELLKNGFAVPAVVCVLSSITLLYFIFKLSYSAFSTGINSDLKLVSSFQKVVLIVLIFLVLILGTYPEPAISWVRFCRELFKAQIL